MNPSTGQPYRDLRVRWNQSEKQHKDLRLFDLDQQQLVWIFRYIHKVEWTPSVQIGDPVPWHSIFAKHDCTWLTSKPTIDRNPNQPRVIDPVPSHNAKRYNPVSLSSPPPFKKETWIPKQYKYNTRCAWPCAKPEWTHRPGNHIGSARKVKPEWKTTQGLTAVWSPSFSAPNQTECSSQYHKVEWSPSVQIGALYIARRVVAVLLRASKIQ